MASPSFNARYVTYDQNKRSFNGLSNSNTATTVQSAHDSLNFSSECKRESDSTCNKQVISFCLLSLTVLDVND